MVMQICLITKTKLNLFFKYSQESRQNMPELKLLSSMKTWSSRNIREDSSRLRKLNLWKLNGSRRQEPERTMRLIEETYNRELLKTVLFNLRRKQLQELLLRISSDSSREILFMFQLILEHLEDQMRFLSVQSLCLNCTAKSNSICRATMTIRSKWMKF